MKTTVPNPAGHDFYEALRLVSRVNVYLDHLPHLLKYNSESVAVDGVATEFLKVRQQEIDDALRHLYQIEPKQLYLLGEA